MNCTIIQRRLLGAEDPAHPPDEVQTHLEGCTGCREWQTLLLQLEQCLVAPGKSLRKVELTGGEYQQDEDDHHQQLGQGIDKARPDVDARTAGAAWYDGHGKRVPGDQRLFSSARPAMVRARMRISARSS